MRLARLILSVTVGVASVIAVSGCDDELQNVAAETVAYQDSHPLRYDIAGELAKLDLLDTEPTSPDRPSDIEARLAR